VAGGPSGSASLARVSIATALRRTPLFETHLRSGARIAPFAGFEMPLQYEGVRPEHLAVREGAGVFDVSHMGEIETVGPQAGTVLQRLLTNDVAAVEVGEAQYSCMCRQDGGVLDDLISYRLGAERYLTVTNAGNRDRDLEWFAQHARGVDAEVRDVGDAYAMLAVQGPRARELVGELAEGALPARMGVAGVRIAGVEALACGTGYTGEDGIELLLEPGAAPATWAALVTAGATPAGLGARDTLRLEACFPLYGNELTLERSPIEAGLGWCCKEETRFIGAEALAGVRAEGSEQRLVPFVLTERGVPRAGNAVLHGAQPIGEVTSGTHSPSLGVGVGLAYVRSELTGPGTEIEIDVRGARRSARVEKRPLYEPERRRG
jgi:aminomethyltransferase